jgi:hypothetical protein
MRSRALLVDWLRMRGVPAHQPLVIEVWDIRPSHAEGRDIKEDEMVWWSGSSSTGKSCATCSWLSWNCDCAVVRMKHFAVRYLKYETESAELTRLSRSCGAVKGGGMHVQGNPSGSTFSYLQGRMHLIRIPVYHNPPSSSYLFSRRLSLKFPRIQEC